MVTRLSHDLTYDASLAEVTAMLLDRGFREQVCERQRVLRADVSVETDSDATEVGIEQVQATRGLPSYATKLVGEEITVVRRETWRTPEAGSIRVSIPGKPGEMDGSIRLVEADGVTTQTVDLRIKVSIPLVGGKVESLLADLMRKALVAEHEVGRGYLSG